MRCRLSWICLLLLLTEIVSPVCRAAQSPPPPQLPPPELAVRASFERDGGFEIQVEVDPRCLEADPKTARYFLHEEWLRFSAAERKDLLDQAKDLVASSLALHFTKAEHLTPAFSFAFTTWKNQPLTRPDEPVMITGVWRDVLPKETWDYSVRVSPASKFKVQVTNIMMGQGIGQVQVLSAGEPSRILGLKPLWKKPSALAGWKGAFESALFAGFLFVWSRGIEHLLFVISLCLISNDRRDWMAQIKVYIIAHLAVIPWGMLPIPPQTGLASAATLVIMALVSLVQRRVIVLRTVLAGVFGLVHGLGFAWHFRHLDQVRNSLATAVPGYMIGILGAQLAGVLIMSGITRPLVHPLAYRRLVTTPFAVLIAAAGVWLFMHRQHG